MAREKRVNVVIRAKDNASKAFKSLKTNILSLRTLMLGGLGFLSFNKILKATVGRAFSAETGLKKLAVAMKAAGRASKANLEFFKDFSVELERTTGFIEEDVLQSLAVLQTFGQMSRNDIELTIKAALDMATVFGETLQQSAIRLGKAYNGNLRGLQMMGIGIDSATFKAKGFQAVLDQLAKEQGGQAVARMAGFEGAVNRVSVAMGEAGKEAGRLVTGSRDARAALKQVADAFQGLATHIKENSKLYQSIISGLVQITKASNALNKLLFKQAAATVNLINKLLGKEDALNKATKATDSHSDSIERHTKVARRQAEVTGRYARVIELNAEALRIFDERLGLSLKQRLAATDEEKKALQKQIDIESEKLTAVNKLRQKLLKEFVASETKAGRWKNQKEEEHLELVERISAKKISLFNTELQQLTIQYKKDLETATTYGQLKADIEAVYAKEKQEIEQKLETERLTSVFSNLQKESEIIEQFNTKQLERAMALADKEIAARQRVADKIANIQSAQVSTALRDENLNWAERNVLLGEQEEKATGLLASLDDITTATGLEKAFDALIKLKDSLSGVEGAERINEILKEASSGIATLSEQLGRAKLSPEIDIEAMTVKMSTAGGKAAAEFKKAFELYLRNNPINASKSIQSSKDIKTSFSKNR